MKETVRGADQPKAALREMIARYIHTISDICNTDFKKVRECIVRDALARAACSKRQRLHLRTAPRAPFRMQEVPGAKCAKDCENKYIENVFQLYNAKFNWAGGDWRSGNIWGKAILEKGGTESTVSTSGSMSMCSVSM